MRIFFRLLSVCAFFGCLIMFALIGYAQFAFPEEYYVVTGDKPVIPRPYSISYSDPSADGVCVSLDTDGKDSETDAEVVLLDVIPVKASKIRTTQRTYVVPLGSAFGIKLYTKGVVVVKTDEVTTSAGSIDPAGSAGIKPGDVITAISGAAVERNEDVSRAFSESGGNELVLNILREGQSLTIRIKPVQSAVDGKYKVGIWVRDSSAGIGTLTFFDRKTGIFAGLGHAVCDVDTGEIMPLSGGEAVEAEIKGSYRGESGAPGELCGIFKNAVIGELLLNSDTGVYGSVSALRYENKQLPVAMSYEINTGPAQIIAEVNGDGKKYYDVEITKIYPNSDSHQKNMVIKVTDPDLIDETGGIVQGMSGSPIIQDGMLVGAVTHVFVNNPEQGYAVFAQSMIETEHELTEVEMKKAS